MSRLTDWYSYADALTDCTRMARSLRKMSAVDAAIGVAWLMGRIVHLEVELSQAREEVRRVRDDAASRVEAAKIDERSYAALLEEWRMR